MIAPMLVLDSREQWWPCAVETILEVGARFGDGTTILNLDELQGRDRLDFPKDMTQPDVPAVGYHRVKDAGSLWWHQFWFFYLFNPKVYAGFGAHEGDWEMVQFGCRDPEGNVPILATYSQHDGGERREFWRVELGVENRPGVYVARDSHANYFSQHRDVTDQADGKGRALATIEWREFGSWADWNGKWGNSDNSPGGLAPRRAWQAPHAYHSQARG